MKEKKATKILMNIGLIFSLLFCLAFACNNSDEQSGGTTSPPQTTRNAKGSGIPSGEYTFMSVASQRSDGSPNVNTGVHGSLVLNDGGTYTHNIYIGNSPSGCGPGIYRISGDTLTLIPNASVGCQAEDWKYIYDPQMNRLSLRDESVTLLYCVAGEGNCFKSE